MVLVAIDGECRWALKRRTIACWRSRGNRVAIDGECRWALKPKGHGRLGRVADRRNRRRMPMGIETRYRPYPRARSPRVAIDGECQWALKRSLQLGRQFGHERVAIDGECRWALKPVPVIDDPGMPVRVAIDGECRWALKRGGASPCRPVRGRRNRRRMPMGIETCW